MVDQLNNLLKNELLAMHQKDQQVREELPKMVVCLKGIILQCKKSMIEMQSG
jgi:hypothetical protein